MKICGICETAANAKIVNQLLEQKTPMRKIAELTGFSKASVGRHAQRCVIRSQAAALKSTRFDPKVNRLLIRWADDPVAPEDTRGKIFVDHTHERGIDRSKPIAPAEIRETDFILCVEYEKPITAKPIADPVANISQGDTDAGTNDVSTDTTDPSE
jgi:hypothetical protein